MTMPLWGTEDPTWQAVEVLRTVKGWVPAEDDFVFVRDLVEQYPRLVMLEEARAWRDWMRDYHPQRRTKHHARFATWCKIASGRRPHAGQRAGRARVGGSPQRAEVGRESSTRLEQW